MKARTVGVVLIAASVFGLGAFRGAEGGIRGGGIQGGGIQGRGGQRKKMKTWEAFELDDLRAERKKKRRSYLSFLDRSTLTTGLYVLKKGAKDDQSPHGQDEVYYVITGKAKFRVGRGAQARDMDARPGTVLFVAAHEEHRFHTIEEDLELLVFFSTKKPAAAARPDKN